jgi:drug/metabolite transporter (DMT)-like permease
MSDTSACAAAETPRSLTDPRFLIPLALFALYVIWGSTYLGIRFALESYPPFLLAGLRFLGAGVVYYGFLRLRGVKPPTFAQWRNADFSCPKRRAR